jgi:hypothetical protein
VSTTCMVNIISLFLYRTVASSKLFQNLHAWFEPMVTRWIDLADLKTIARIDKAVELDEVSTMYINSITFNA